MPNLSFTQMGSDHTQFTKYTNALKTLRGILRPTLCLDNMPAWIVVEISNRCNLSCRMCRTPNYWNYLCNSGFYIGEIKEKVFQEIIPILPYAQSINLSWWGEPLMHSRFMEIVRTIRSASNEIEIALTTNFTLATKEIINCLIDQNVTQVAISMDSPSKETFEYIRIGASYDQIVRNIEALVETKAQCNKCNPKLNFCMVLMKPNIHELLDFSNFILPYQPACLVLHDIEENIASEFYGPEKFYLSDEDYRAHLPLFIETMENVRRNGIMLVGSGVHRFTKFMEDDLASSLKKKNYLPSSSRVPCIEPFYAFFVEASGDIKPCCYYQEEPLGNLAEESLLDIWNGIPFQKLREELITSKFNSSCEACLREGWKLRQTNITVPRKMPEAKE